MRVSSAHWILRTLVFLLLVAPIIAAETASGNLVEPEHALLTLTRPASSAWGEPTQGLAIGIARVRCYYGQPRDIVIDAWLENRGDTSLPYIIQSSAEFVVELDGHFYAINSHGGRSAPLAPGMRWGPVVLRGDEYKEIPSLQAHPSEFKAPLPPLVPGQHTLRIHYHRDRDFASCAPVSFECPTDVQPPPETVQV